MNIPEGHQAVMPYCMVVDASKFIEFTQATFGAEVVTLQKVKESSTSVIHAEIQIGESTIMFADASPEEIACSGPEKGTGVNGAATIQLFAYVDDADETVERALSAGATKIFDVSDQEGGRVGGIQDPFGNLWWVRSVW